MEKINKSEISISFCLHFPTSVFCQILSCNNTCSRFHWAVKYDHLMSKRDRIYMIHRKYNGQNNKTNFYAE